MSNELEYVLPKTQTLNVQLSRRDIKVQVSEGGSGKINLVYLHGFNGFEEWPSFLEELEQDFHIYVPSHPGISNSDGLDKIDDLWDLILFYEELINELNIDNTVLIGHSYGGMVAAELASQIGNRISKMILVDSLGLWLNKKPIPDIFMLTPSERHEISWHNPYSEIAQFYENSFYNGLNKDESNLERTKTLMAIGKFCWPIPDKGLQKRIHRINAPTLLVWGEHDRIVPPEYGHSFQRQISGSTLAIIEDSGHIPHEESKPLFTETITNFLIDN